VDSNTNIKLQWTAPSSNSAIITAYRVLILSNDGLYYPQTNCDETQIGIVATQYCIVSMTILRASPFNLILGNMVRAKA
jgi:hypothetical protein